MIRVTFDSNVWQQIVSPTDYLNDGDAANFEKINKAIKSNVLAGYISDVIFTIEAIKKDFRQIFINTYEPTIETVIADRLSEDGMHIVNITIGPNTKVHPADNTYLSKYLDIARKLGIDLIECIRLGQITNPLIDQSFYAKKDNDDFNERMNRCSDCCEYIENLGCGISWLKNIGSRFVSDPLNWRTGLKFADPTESKNISRAMAEWADGDTVAAHYGYKNDYLCTLDWGKRSGERSIFYRKNRDLVAHKFGIKFVTPGDLCELI